MHALASSTPEADHEDVTWHAADLLDSEGTSAVIREVRADRLLHLAWHSSHVWRTTRDEHARWQQATAVLHEAFTSAGGGRAVLVGTCAEYGRTDGDCDELTTPLQPESPYGTAKVATFRAAERHAAAGGTGFAWARIFFPYGPGEAPSRLLPTVARGLLAGERVACPEGTAIRDALYVDDVGRALADLLLSSVEGPVNIGSGTPVSVRTLLAAVGTATGRGDLLDFGAVPPRDDPPRLVADVVRLHDEVGFRPQVGLADGIGRAVEAWTATA